MNLAIITAILLVCFFLMMSLLGVFSIVCASIIDGALPSKKEASAEFIRAWCSLRGLRNRLLLIPVVLTGVTVAILEVKAATDTHQVRANITKSTKLIIRTGGNCHRDREYERVLLETDQASTINDLANRLSVSSSSLGVIGGRCRCCGEITFDFYQGVTPSYSFSLHHGASIRLKDFAGGDKELSEASKERLAAWLDSKGVAQLLKQTRERKLARLDAAVDQWAREKKAKQDAATNADQPEANKGQPR